MKKTTAKHGVTWATIVKEINHLEDRVSDLRYDFQLVQNELNDNMNARICEASRMLRNKVEKTHEWQKTQTPESMTL